MLERLCVSLDTLDCVEDPHLGMGEPLEGREGYSSLIYIEVDMDWAHLAIAHAYQWFTAQQEYNDTDHKLLVGNIGSATTILEFIPEPGSLNTEREME